jgi:general secretion pathway protein E
MTLLSEPFDRAVLGAWPREFLTLHAVVPLREEDGALVIAGAEEAHAIAYEIGMLRDRPIRFLAAEARDVRRFINERYDSDTSRREAIEEMDGDSSEARRELEELANDAPVVRFVTSILQTAIERRASDIHIEPYEAESAIRLRIDGHLGEHDRIPRGLHPGVVSRVKIMARLDIAQTRQPQDGRISVNLGGREIDLRVSTIPTPQGERIVLRLLDRSSVRFGMEELGFEGADLVRWNRLITHPNGIILVTGPTGSGKTTTLYAALDRLRSGAVNILTVEDPVEYQIEGVGQMQVNPKLNVTFASGLRAILRQDPDIIMVGEIRDSETAVIAIQGALTGHLVLSTLHTNDAPSAAPRLVDMGVEPYLLASTLRGVLGQRLVRRLCPHCRRERPASAGERAALGLAEGARLFDAVGCERCGNVGYRGRIGLFELMEIDDEIRDGILKRRDAVEIGRAARKAGMRTIREDGLARVLAGLTTAEEVLRVTAIE